MGSEPLKGQDHESRVLSDRVNLQAGWFGADIWTVISIYLRNFLLNLLICFAFGKSLKWMLLNQSASLPMITPDYTCLHVKHQYLITYTYYFANPP